MRTYSAVRSVVQKRHEPDPRPRSIWIVRSRCFKYSCAASSSKCGETQPRWQISSSPKRNIDPRGIDGHAGVADRRQNAAPVGIASRPRGLDQRRVGDGAGYAQSIRIGERPADVELDHVLNAFPVLHDLLGQR